MKISRFVLIASASALFACVLVAEVPAQPQTLIQPGLAQQPAIAALTAPWQHDGMFPDAKASPAGGFFRQDRPTLIVLIHGQTDKKEGPLSPVGTLSWGRARWGYAFAAEILGGGPLSTLPSANVGAESLDAATWPEGGAYEPIAMINRLSTVGVDAGRPEHHIIVRAKEVAKAQAMGKGTSPHVYDRMLFIAHRDGSGSLHDQVKMFVDQLFENYEVVFGKGEEPQIILVAHSMGGLVSRYLLSNPFNHLSEPRWHFRANFIRNRTVSLVTLATPHQGSPMADYATRIRQMIDSLPEADLMIGAGVWSPPPNKLKAFLRSNFSKLWDPSITDLQVSSMARSNGGTLHPARAAREDGTLVPIYAISGRTPALDLLNDPGVNLATLNQKIQRLDDEHRYETFGLIVLSELLIRTGGGWGRTPAEGPNLDWIERVSLNEMIERHIGEATEKFKDPFTKAVADSLGGIRKAATRQLTNFSPVKPLYLDRKWGLQWGTCQVPFEHAVCGTYRAPSPPPSKVEDFPGWIAGVLRTLAMNAGQIGECAVNWSKWERRHTVGIPCFGLGTAGFTGRPSDREIDTDGLVALDSALGARLLGPGTEYEYFDHRKPYQALGKSFSAGSWYRFPDGPWNMDNHGSIVSNPAVGRWIRETVVSQAGPLAGPGPVSTYPPLAAVPVLRR